MFRLISRLALVLIIAAAVTAPVSAGGMATVHLDAPPQNVVAGVPFALGFMVMQHDVSPVNVDSAIISATHRESGQTYMESARQDGAVGHYVAELTFPTAGSWKWMIIPAPFAGTSFESLLVQDAAGATADKTASANHPAHIHTGSCQELGDVQFPLSDVAPSGSIANGTPDTTTGTVGVNAGVPVAISTTSVAVTLAELLAEPHAINIHKSADDIGTYVACGNISGRLAGGTLVVGLQELNDSSDAGVAILTEANEQTEVALYMLIVESAAMATGATAKIEIRGSQGNWAFEPARLEIAAGTTVTWLNKTETSHTVMGSDLAFEDSGPFGAEETFSQVFTRPGIYQYQCGPHPFMLGTIVVT